MTRLWFAANHGDLGGGEVMTLNLAAAARDLGYDVGIVAPDHPARLVTASRAAGFRTVEIHGRTSSRYATNLRAWDLLARKGVLWANGLRAALATAGHRDRIVHLHQVPRGKQSWVLGAASLGSRALVVPSEFAAAQVPGSVVLPNWTQPLGAPDFARRLVTGNADGPVRLGFLGRLSILKGVVTLAEAVAILDRDEPGRYRLLLAGEPTYTTPRDREAVDAAIAPIAHLLDQPGWMEPSAFFSSVDLAVFPSAIAESFGLVVAEAMSVGCPYVISDAGALSEVAGSHPFIAHVDNPASLATTVKAAVSTYADPLLRASYDRWAAHYSPAAGAKAVHGLLTEWGIRP